MRMLLASIFILPFLLNRSKKHSFKDHSLSFLLIGILNTALPFTLFAYASLQLGAGSLSVLQATVPILTALILWIDKNNNSHHNELSISLNCTSKNTVESKSMKLFLGSLVHKKFKNISENNKIEMERG